LRQTHQFFPTDFLHLPLPLSFSFPFSIVSFSSDTFHYPQALVLYSWHSPRAAIG
jgi:hypothetical protein